MGYASDANRLAIETAHPYFRVVDVLISEGFAVSAIAELFGTGDTNIKNSLSSGVVPPQAASAAPAVERAVYGLIAEGKLPHGSGKTAGRMDRTKFILLAKAKLGQ